ncbi:MAG: Glycosyl transferase family 2 [Candidatus Woesebacteria bacterium GW2011_GWB1_38_5b]|uniref:Glycosyl transferase family 2 n=1 Tax=Candidatus Woesebacteria bacterium GW2011_GWB1_38_5b TaxID=1618569 RepID=A0A0G0NF39_9BACT|nr:MAG: Glycosyl transferase family 2 [Candidatus Woesebacteria bacterium GW2011_GWB1_38_5b]
MKSRISVIVPTWNGEKTIKACINSLLVQTVKPAEVIVVDNASVDSTLSIVNKIKQHSQKVKIVRNNKNLGVAGGRNTGIKAAAKSSNYIFLFDHDMVASKKMLEELVNTVKKTGAGLVTPKIYYLKPGKLIWAAGTGVNLWTGQVIFRGGKDRGQFDAEVEVDVAPAAMLIARKVLRKVRGFDERIFAVWEDTDFSFKVRKAGFKIYYSPKAVASHDLLYEPEAEAKRLLVRYGYFIGRNRIIFMKRYAKSFPLFLTMLPVYAFYYLRLALRYNELAGYYKFLKGNYDGLMHEN